MRAIHFDPYSQVRPSRAAGNQPNHQRRPPPAHAAEEDDFSDCCLNSIMATDVMAAITQVCAGHYDQLRTLYLPPAPFRDWSDVVMERSFSHSHGLPKVDTTPNSV